TEVTIERELSDATRDLDHGVAAQRKARGADSLGVDVAAKRLVRQHLVDHVAKVLGALPPQQEALSRVRLKRVVARMVPCRRKVPVGCKLCAQPSNHER